MKFILSNCELDSDLARDFQNIQSYSVSDCNILINDSATILESPDKLSITDGYLRDTHETDISRQKLNAVSHVFYNWPVADNITGSFSSIILDKSSSKFVLATDLTNIYPIYYLKRGSDYFISNSIILLGRYSNAEYDPTGIFQRAVGPSFMNIGSRTILKDCKRLLPGEWIKFDRQGIILEKRYDNSLYGNMGSPNIQDYSLNDYWEAYKKEVELCTKDFDHVNIALSGGIDSRVCLGAIENKAVSAFTFGDQKNYESKIAHKLAKKKGADHSSIYDPDKYFPPRDILEEFSRETEAVKLNSWIELLSNVFPQKKEPILLGELCEGLPGRNIKSLNSGKFRKENFYKYYLRKEEVSLKNSDSNSFSEWKKTKKAFILSWHVPPWFKKLNLENEKNEIIKNTERDLDEILIRIEDHNLPYYELFDELFSWYTFTRMELSRQVNICNEKFYAFSPGMSLQMLKRTSNLHPNVRLYYRFANKLLSTIPDLKPFKPVPTSQIPFIPQSSPDIFKIPVWGIRSKIDDYLIKRLMKSNNINSRYRLLRSINWVKIYQHKDMLENIHQYYERNELSEDYFQTYFELAKNRKYLQKWPFANMDIISGAVLNTELNLISRFKN